MGSKFDNEKMLDDVLNLCQIQIPTIDKKAIKERCGFVASAVKTSRAGIDIKSMQPEERKAYLANKVNLEVDAVQKAFVNKMVSKPKTINRDV